jgi:hypothetical protein
LVRSDAGTIAAMVPRLKTALVGPLEIEALHTVPPAAVAAAATTV